jgi:lysophospholipase L1-like esterase
MLDCIILGDSIAVGLGQARPDCDVFAVSGITSDRYVQTLLTSRQARTVIISLGVNDGEGAATADNLLRLRAAITA